MVALIVFVIVAVGIFLVLGGDPPEDVRERREIDGISCIYNVTTDEIEDCVEETSG